MEKPELNTTEADRSLVVSASNLFGTLAGLAGKDGVTVSPFQSEELPIFRQLPVDQQLAIIDHLKRITDLMASIEINQKRLPNNLASVWGVLSKLRWRHASDLFTTLKEDDVVEIYALNGVQIFSTFNFFKSVSYTLEQIASIPWTQLFERPNKEIFLSQLDWERKMKAGEILSTTKLPLPHYEVVEVFSRRGLTNIVEHRCLSPLWERNGKLIGYINAIRSHKTYVSEN